MFITECITQEAMAAGVNCTNALWIFRHVPLQDYHQCHSATGMLRLLAWHDHGSSVQKYFILICIPRSMAIGTETRARPRKKQELSVGFVSATRMHTLDKRLGHCMPARHMVIKVWTLACDCTKLLVANHTWWDELPGWVVIPSD